MTTGNADIWDALGKTDPDHTKNFKRGGGFSGTAIKPMWVLRRLTEQFGPCGEGWGVSEPQFQVLPGASGETLVYCTVSCWHGKPENILWGVGGDKLIVKNRHGLSSDDEAFKKAFTDAINNAFKFIGVGADVHMGMFDDSKYVAEVREEFHPPEATIDDAQLAQIQTLGQQANADLKKFCEAYGIGSVPELPASKFDHAIAALKKKLAQKTEQENPAA